MNNTSFLVWVHQQLEPDSQLTGGRTRKMKREPIDPEYFAAYKRNNPELTSREREEREDKRIAEHLEGHENYKKKLKKV